MIAQEMMSNVKARRAVVEGTSSHNRRNHKGRDRSSFWAPLVREATEETPVDGVSVMKNPMLGRRSLVYPKVCVATWVQTVNTPVGFRAEVSQLHRSRARSWRRYIMVQKEGGATWQVPARLEGAVEDSGAVPPYG